MTMAVFARTVQAQNVKEGSVFVHRNCGTERSRSLFPHYLCANFESMIEESALTSLESRPRIINDSLAAVARESIWEISDEGRNDK